MHINYSYTGRDRKKCTLIIVIQGVIGKCTLIIRNIVIQGLIGKCTLIIVIVIHGHDRKNAH
jgi:hypothetical protein